MWNLREYRRRPDRLSDHLPWAALVAPDTVLNKDASLTAVIRFRGPDVESASPQDLMAVRARFNHALMMLGSGWCVHVESLRRRCPAPPKQTLSRATAQRIEDERYNALRHAPALESAQYVSLTYLPPSERVSRPVSWLQRSADGPTRGSTESWEESVRSFERQVEQIMGVLASALGEVQRLRSGDLLSFLHDRVSDRRLLVTLPEIPCYLDERLTDASLLGGTSPQLGERYLKVVSVRDFPPRTRPCLLAELDALPMEFRWCVRLLTLDKSEAASELTRRRRQWFARRKSMGTLLKEVVTKTESALVDPDSDAKAAEITDGLEALGADCCGFAYATLTITTWAKVEQDAERNAQAVQRVCDGAGLVSRIEDYNAVEAWLGSLPGHAYADLRRPILATLSATDLMPIAAAWSGDNRCAHLDGPPLALCHTEGSTPFRLNLHVGDVGHALIAGPTGAGKSALLNFLAAQCFRYSGAQVYFFDKGRSSLPMTLAMGGQFHDLDPQEPTISFQPLAALDEPGELAWAETWLLDVLSREGVESEPSTKQELRSALANLATMPRSHRTLTTLLELVQNARLRDALRTYTLDGPHGHLLDADTDSLAACEWQSFEMGALIGSPAMVPVLTYLFHRLEQRLGAPLADPATGVERPRPTFLFLDEAWLLLGDSMFARKIREWLKTLRKKNVAVVFATQSLADIADSPIAAAILESCPTRILLPNPSATEERQRALYESFGLSGKQIALIQRAIPKRDYYYHSPAGNRLFQLGLGPVAKALCSGGSAEVQAAIPGLLAEHGREEFAEAYLRAFAGDAHGAPTPGAAHDD